MHMIIILFYVQNVLFICNNFMLLQRSLARYNFYIERHGSFYPLKRIKKFYSRSVMSEFDTLLYFKIILYDNSHQNNISNA